MGKIEKSEVLKAIKSYKFSSTDIKKNAELMEAIKNGTEENIMLVEHKAKVQVAHMDLDITFEGETSTMTRTVNQQITSAKHIWLVEGDVKVAEVSELRNGLSANLESTKTTDMRSKVYGQYVYQNGNLDSAASLIARHYAQNYAHKLNLTYKNSRVNSGNIIVDSDPYELSFWEVYFTYKNKKGKEKKVAFGNVFQEDMSEENEIKIMPFENFYKKRLISADILKIVGISLGVLAVIGVIIWGILRM